MLKAPDLEYKTNKYQLISDLLEKYKMNSQVQVLRRAALEKTLNIIKLLIKS